MAALEMQDEERIDVGRNDFIEAVEENFIVTIAVMAEIRVIGTVQSFGFKTITQSLATGVVVTPHDPETSMTDDVEQVFEHHAVVLVKPFTRKLRKNPRQRLRS